MTSRSARNGAGIALDDVSKAIIEELQQDGRRSYAAIGKVVGLSEAAVRQRVQRLVDSGVMQVVAVTDPPHSAFPRRALTGSLPTGRPSPMPDPRAPPARAATWGIPPAPSTRLPEG